MRSAFIPAPVCSRLWLLAVLLAATSLARPAAAAVVRDDRTRMAAPMSIQIDAPADRAGAARAAMDAAYAEVDRLVALVSEWIPASDISRVNAAAGSSIGVQVAPETFTLVAKSVEIGNLTSGAFDVTFLPLGRAWDFKRTPPVVPAPEVIARARARVDYRRIVLDPAAHTVALADSGMAMGLGGIAQGYIADRVAELIRSHGFSDFVIDVSGDLRVDGRVGGHPWRVGIQDPRRRGQVVASLPLADGISVVTSGDYERYFEVEGRRYHHIMDPATGYPAMGCQSVTVVSKDTGIADALATGLFVLGPERGLALAERLPDVEALIIDANGAMHTTTGFVLGEPAAPAAD
jgi:thiamine biosynthesis lipoprotein